MPVETPPREPGTSRATPRRRRFGLKTVITVAIVALLAWIAWEYIGTNAVAEVNNGEMITAVQKGDTVGDATNDPLVAGQSFAVLRIPRFGDDAEFPIVEGVEDEELTSGVGHFKESERPGQIGNFAIAGHRITRGQPFLDFPKIRKGDKVYITTRTHEYTYVLDMNGTDKEVDFTDTSVIDANPLAPGTPPQLPMITLTTCAEVFHTDERSVVFGHLVGVKHR